MHMPETMTDKIVPEIPTEAVPETAAPRSRTGFFSTAYSSPALLTEPISTGPVEDGSTAPSMKSEDPELPWLRINWEIKALVPIAFVLLGGMLLFLLATLSWRDPERHMVSVGRRRGCSRDLRRSSRRAHLHRAAAHGRVAAENRSVRRRRSQRVREFCPPQR